MGTYENRFYAEVLIEKLNRAKSKTKIEDQIKHLDTENRLRKIEEVLNLK